MPTQTPVIKLRDDVAAADASHVRRIVESTGFFHGYEVDVAVELVDARLAQGPASGYHFVFAEVHGETIGYACYGPIACTQASYDLYWIAVEEGKRGSGLGRKLLEASEQRIAAAGGLRVYVETSSKPQYEPTRQFYLRCGYHIEATLVDFYAPGDGKVIFVKAL
jgi:GNAT superfamily N-acetyltransferase